MTENAKGLTDLGLLVYRFSRVDRMTCHEDGVTPESDTDHTVMLTLCASALAQKLYPDTLDVGLVAQFATVHDLMEAYALDTDTFGLQEAELQEKAEREQAAFLRIQAEFKDVFPWLPETIERYEALDTREARFVKTVDKIMHKISHILNKGAYFKKRGMDSETMWSEYVAYVKPREERYGSEFPEVLALLDEMIRESRSVTYES